MLELNPQTTVQALFAAHPEAFEVLHGYGMCEPCRSAPPPVPLEHFAAKHCGGNIEKLLEELRAVCG